MTKAEIVSKIAAKTGLEKQVLNGSMKKSTKDYKKEIQKAEQILNSLQQ